MESSAKTYSDYKYSGEGWIGDIPLHWEIKKIKHLFYEKKITYNLELPCGSISFGIIVYKHNEKIPESTKRTYQVLSKGEFLINPLNLNYDLISLRIGLSEIDVVVSSGYIILKSIPKLNKEYYKWLLHRYDVAFMKTLGSGVRQTINFNHISNCLLPYPPLEEQTAIASFLDRKTALIDQAIEIKQKQIELLKERKQILIQNAVTRGLNPNVKMKDSGVEWIGEIPEHWEVKRFRNFFLLFKGLTITKENLIDHGIFCVNYGEIHSKYGFAVNPDVDELKCVSEDYLKTDPNSLLKYGDFIFADTSEDIEGSGNFTFLNSNIRTFAGYHTIIAKPKYYNFQRFFAYIFDSVSFRNQIRVKVKGVKVFSITQSILKELYIWLPPEEEQVKIIIFLDEQIQKIQNAINSEVEEINKLKEYKSTLINSAVTGKIKVS